MLLILHPAEICACIYRMRKAERGRGSRGGACPGVHPAACNRRRMRGGIKHAARCREAQVAADSRSPALPFILPCPLTLCPLFFFLSSPLLSSPSCRLLSFLQLNVNNNFMTALPESFCLTPRLQVVYLSNNRPPPAPPREEERRTAAPCGPCNRKGLALDLAGCWRVCVRACMYVCVCVCVCV